MQDSDDPDKTVALGGATDKTALAPSGMEQHPAVNPGEELARLEKQAGISTPGSEKAPPPEARKSNPLPGKPRKIGLVLNGLWTVQRRIGGGGMGEVYEGVGALGQRVAIKFLYPSFRANLRIFQTEAQNLMNLAKLDATLVQYYAFSDAKNGEGDPYIVMEYVNGPTLAQAIPKLHATLEQVVRFGRRMASALHVVHRAGIIHRDLSPMNVMLPDDDLERAKIIDFGIAKDLTLGDETIIAGFKGNLGYAAPEQFDDLPAKTKIGPWTDVYSLGLVLVALAAGKPVPMGKTLLEAVQQRTRVPDLFNIPAPLQPVLRSMLAPDPADRLRSMPEVVERLDKLIAPPVKPLRWRVPAFAGAVVLAIVAGAFAVFTEPSESQVRRNIVASLRASDCSWLALDSLDRTNGVFKAKLSGVATNGAAVESAARDAAGTAVDFDSSAVASVQPNMCGPLNAMHAFREPDIPLGPSLRVYQEQFRLENDLTFCPTTRGMRQARVMVDLRIEDPSVEFALLGLESNGQMQQLISNRADFEAQRARRPLMAPNLGGNIYQLSFCVDEATAARISNQGKAGLVLVKGKKPFVFSLGLDPNATDSAPLPPDWPARFTAEAQKQGWTTQIAWYEIVSR